MREEAIENLNSRHVYLNGQQILCDIETLYSSSTLFFVDD